MLSLALRTLVHFRTLLAPVSVGVAIATAVMVGALVVGDSMRGSLRFIALDRIGQIESLIIAPRWFDESLAKNLVLHGLKAERVQTAVFVQQAVAERETTRASEMSLFGVEDRFWGWGTFATEIKINDEEVVLNTALAEKLQAKVGDLITLRVASQAVVPADSPLGRRDQDTIVLPRWKVIAILPDRSLARFSLRSDQRPIYNAFANKSSLQQALEIAGRVNAILIQQDPNAVDVPATSEFANAEMLLRDLSPELSDLGLKWERVQRMYPENQSDAPESENASSKTVYDYHQLTTDQLLLADSLAKPIREATKTFEPTSVLTYLANGTRVTTPDKTSKRDVPYSTVSGIAWERLRGLLISAGVNESDAATPSMENWTVINSWLAKETGATVGDKITIDYFLPETVDGEEVETSAELQVIAIAPLTEPSEDRAAKRGAARYRYDQPPTPFNDSSWTPVVPGITDRESISKWDAPFRKTRATERSDDDYWDRHHLTPKLFVADAMATRLFGSRFGKATSLRYDGLNAEQANQVSKQITEIVRARMSDLGWRAIPLRQQQLKAASGTTPFDALFMSLSFFVIVAALLLVAILFRLSIDQRANHWGLLMAAGWKRSSVRRLLLVEGLFLSGIGASLGVPIGLLYAYAMIAGLRSWWIGAISVSFLDYHVQPVSLVLGWVLGTLSALLTILIATRQLKQIPIARLLKRQWESGPAFAGKKGLHRWLAAVCVLIAVSVLAVGQFLQGQAQAGAFVGAGMLLLIAGLVWIYTRLRLVPATADRAIESGVISQLSFASSNAKRAPIRSILSIGLVAVASFLIVSMSLFQSAPNSLGTGQFLYVGKSAQPIYKDLSNETYQREVLGTKREQIANVGIVPIRLRGGDDASCNNLFQANEPQVMGIDKRIAEVDNDGHGRSAFAWFAQGIHPSGSSVWSLLESNATGEQDSPIPVVIDQNTALWALHLGGYVGEVFSYAFDGRKVHFKTVGVLQNTILQGSLIVGEANFEKTFPSVTGHRMFLFKSAQVGASPTDTTKASESYRNVFEQGWSDEGLSLAPTESILRQLLAVQNTYLGAFQVLGGLGLLLGTIGLGIAQVRSAFERRSELAAMRAMGFSRPRLVWLLSLENAWQLLRGLGIGVGAACLATLPAIVSGQPFAGFASPLSMLGFVLLSGLICSLVAAYTAMRWPLLKALRSE
jgi:ABC-type lipoprotein release transport system permease subunit